MATQAQTPAVRTAADILGAGAAPRTNGKSQATVIEQSRAVAEVQGALVIAQQRPRDRARALNEALESCRTREVAEGAFFKFSRGGGTVAGETIHLARELARCWGNILFTVAELDRDDELHRSEMVAFAWDLETNAQARTSFIVPHVRDKSGGGKLLTDMRDIYENNANMGARRLRECIFAVLPPYLVKAAADECRMTLERGESEEPLAVRVGKLLTAFAQLGIDKARIEARHGPVDRFTPVDLANLRIAYQSIRRGEISAEEEFPRAQNGDTGPSKLDMLEESIETETPAEETPAPAKPNRRRGQAAEKPEPAHQPEGPADEQRGEHDVPRQTADRLIADAKTKELLADLTAMERSAEFNEAYGGLDDDLKLEVDGEIAQVRQRLSGAAG